MQPAQVNHYLQVTLIVFYDLEFPATIFNIMWIKEYLS